jgi:predicted DNA repair protein MutK
MAGSSLLLLIDDIATLLDDVAAMTKVAASKSVAMADDVSVMTKVAAQKTAGVLGDDLALNAQQVAGVTADRELPVVWAVAKGSMVNKAILVPAALAISALAPWAVTPLLMVGGAYLCVEGFEKVAHKYLHSPAEEDAPPCRTGPGGDRCDRRPRRVREEQDQGGGAHRLRVVRRDHRHHAGHGGGSPVPAASGCPDRDRP